MKTLAQKVQQIAGLLGTKDLSDWEQQFVESVNDRVIAANGDTRGLSAKQAEVIERIWSKHFA